MDEKPSVEIYWPIETIPDPDFVYRRVFYSDLKGVKPRRFPNDSHFKLHSNETGLSVNWDKYTDVKGTFILTGLTYRKGTEGSYIDYKSFQIFKFNVGGIRLIEGIQHVNHDPCYNGNPARTGEPNNRAHSVIVYLDDEQIRMELSDYCNSNFDESKCQFDVKSLENEITKLRARLNDTPYHKLQEL